MKKTKYIYPVRLFLWVYFSLFCYGSVISFFDIEFDGYVTLFVVSLGIVAYACNVYFYRVQEPNMVPTSLAPHPIEDVSLIHLQQIHDLFVELEMHGAVADIQDAITEKITSQNKLGGTLYNDDVDGDVLV